MFKLATAFTMLFCMTNAGYLTSPLVDSPLVGYHAPLVAAPVVKAAVPVATSYQNLVKISSPSVPVVVKAAPILAPALPIAHAPIIKSPLLAAPLPYGWH
ncbi:cuticle protein 70, isoforms A and B-like [Euwallacea fornicatus]|uniref:cuticle protein 70, isoforms A and B-like n=1 Tax=Euwallacea fornicatus TaxID=995702 RepID=UPI00338F8D8E